MSCTDRAALSVGQSVRSQTQVKLETLQVRALVQFRRFPKPLPVP